MKRTNHFLILWALLAATAGVQGATPRSDQFLRAIQFTPGTPTDDRPLHPDFGKARMDTIWYGGHDGNGYAVEGGVWDFEDGQGGGDLQGWYGVDLTENTGAHWGARVTADDFDCPAEAPIIDAGLGNSGQLWFGKHGEAADQGCWVCDAGGDCSDPASRVGYANNLCQQADSPPLPYSDGDITLRFDYFLDCEGHPYDFVRVQLVPIVTGFEETPVLIKNVDDGTGGNIGSPDEPAAFFETLSASAIPGGTTSFKVRFEFTSDGGWSDEDAGGNICSTFGPFGADSIVVTETGAGELAAYDFEEGDEGFSFAHCPGVGDFVDIHPLDDYTLLEPCDCGLDGWILAYHDENFEHPGDSDGSGTGQANVAVSPIVDRSDHPAPDFNDIFYEADLYAWLPLNNGVLYRPGAQYYPWTCTESGFTGWSPRIGQDTWWYWGDPICYKNRNNFTVDGVPGNADLYRVMLEVLSCCYCFGIGDDCTGVTNETPLLDNIRFGLSGMRDVPVITLDTWGLQDGFSSFGRLDPSHTGRSDDAIVDAGSEPPFVLADSLGIAGPVVSGDTDPWEAYLWFRIHRKGPRQDEIPAYAAWKARLAGDVETDFVSVRMDSSQLGSNVFPNKYCSFAHPSDPFYAGDPEADERSDLNEILPDLVFTSGTRIDYFVTANYLGSAEKFFLPDTAGGGFLEYEILPSMRLDNQHIVWPCVLYWDAYNRGAQEFIEPALESILPRVPGDGPNHDRYDELGASSNFNGSSIYRLGVGANNGGTLAQLLGYRTIICNTGTFDTGATEESDWIGAEDWLRTTICDVSFTRQAFIANGDEIAGIIEHLRPSFLTGTLGTIFDCSPYREPDCPSGTTSDSSFCVSLFEAAGAPYGPLAPYYALGNGCPNIFTFSVLSPTGEGMGNRSWLDYDALPPPDGKGIVEFAQIVNDQATSLGNYRSVVDGYSYHHITTTFDTETNSCETDSAGRVDAIANEVAAALDWSFGGSVPAFCDNPCLSTTDAPDTGGSVELSVNRLYQNEPNPFNPRTAVRFSVASREPVELRVFDVGGRLVRTLVERPMDAGLHTVVWDGTDNEGHRVGSGIYWTRLEVGDYASSMKMVLLK